MNIYSNKFISRDTNEANVQPQWLILRCKWVFSDFLRAEINQFHLNCKNNVNNVSTPYSQHSPDFPTEASWGIDDVECFYPNFSLLEDLEEYSILTVGNI